MNKTDESAVQKRIRGNEAYFRETYNKINYQAGPSIAISQATSYIDCALRKASGCSQHLETRFGQGTIENWSERRLKKRNDEFLDVDIICSREIPWIFPDSFEEEEVWVAVTAGLVIYFNEEIDLDIMLPWL